MSCETIDKIIFAILGAVIGGVCTYIGAVQIAKKNKRLDAGIALYETFRTTIRELEKEGGLDTQAIVMSPTTLGKQVTEIERFRFHIPKRKRIAFIAAWNEYYKKGHENKFTDEGQKEHKRQLALNHIYKILSFADYEPLQENKKSR